MAKIEGLKDGFMFEAWNDASARIYNLFFSSCLVKAQVFALALLSLALAILSLIAYFFAILL